MQFAEIVAFYGFRGGEGGISHVMLNLMNAIVATGVRVDLLLNATNIPELAKLDPRIRVVRLGEVGSIRRVLALSSYFRRERPFALLANRETANRTAVAAKMLSRVPVRLVFRVGMAISAALERRSLVKRLLRLWSMLLCYRRADVIIANAQGVSRDLTAILGLPPERIAVLDNPTFSDELLVLAAEAPEHPWFGTGQPPVILGVGRLVRQKDFASLIRAFARVRAKRSCRLMVLGEGKERASLMKLADELGVREDLDMPGFVVNPFRYMAHSAAFVLSSAWEGSPNVLIQALAIGVPCVATDSPGGAREILADGLYGPLVPVGDVESMAIAIAAVLDQPAPRESLRTAADRFRTDACSRAYLQAMGLPTAGGVC